ncbi:MAG: hypothetical protein ASARMPRED_000666 [Alectoria sarmentosa]|nr:MAG: hypothetical protein ASARMPRED_000666 [Alectoria sarmentosa]
MASQDTFNPLRVVTQRLSSTPSKQLPHVAPYLATTITQCGKAFTAPSNNGQIVGGVDSVVIFHKLKTQLSALLQDKGPEARYAAVILIKATVEVGGWNVLQGVGAWVRGLVGIVGKPDFPGTTRLCIITLTRIFLLTHEHQSLVREITTPSLPGFITACLNLIKDPRSLKAAQISDAHSPLLLVVLHALSELITMHPTSFRPFVPQIQSLTHPLIAPTPSNIEYGENPASVSASVSKSARRLFALLHVSAPKNTTEEEWAKSLDVVILSAQRTADKVFRSLIEDWTPSIGKHDIASSVLVEETVSDQKPTPLALPAWTGIYAGTERLDGLLHILQAFLGSATASAVALPVGNILNLVDRVLSTFPPSNGRNPQVRHEIGRDEREGLWVGLPRLQISTIGVCSLMISRMGHSSAAIAPTILEQLLWTFESQYGNDGFRRAAYELTSQILIAFGPSLPRSYAISLSRCIRMCCEDLLPSVESQLQDRQVSFSKTTKRPSGITSSTNADSYLKSTSNQVDVSDASPDVLEAARALLPLTLMNLPNEYLPFSLRCQIDRTAIITNNRKAMLSSVINPTSKRKRQKQTSSILPFLARSHPEALEVEVMLRPQMPPIKYRRSDGREMESEVEEDSYMHDHPQISENDGFYQDSVGTNGSANVEKNIIAVGHNGAEANAATGAVGEAAASTEPTGVFQNSATDLPLSGSAISYTSTKRDREEESRLDIQEFDRGNSTEQVVIGMANKRARVGFDEPLKEALMEPAPEEPVIVDTGGPDHAVRKSSLSGSGTASDRQPILHQEDSDESDFEMPILNLDPDTDEEDEEEGEEDD